MTPQSKLEKQHRVLVYLCAIAGAVNFVSYVMNVQSGHTYLACLNFAAMGYLVIHYVREIIARKEYFDDMQRIAEKTAAEKRWLYAVNARDIIGGK